MLFGLLKTNATFTLDCQEITVSHNKLLLLFVFLWDVLNSDCNSCLKI